VLLRFNVHKLVQILLRELENQNH